MKRAVIVGFMASGKTQVGRALAGLLGWRFLDFDSVIEEASGSSIAEIFQRHGEAHFRELETETGQRLLRLNDVVLATGGGWPVQVGRMESLPPGTSSVWLQVEPEVAVARAEREGPTRPLLDCADPLERARILLREREPFYRLADLAIDSSSAGPDILAQRIRDFFLEAGSDTVQRPPPQK